MREICEGARQAGAWVHIDGAFGLWARAAPTLAHLADGAELAHSWATDGHKWLNVPYDSGLAIVSDVLALRRAVAVTAAYLLMRIAYNRWMSLRSLPGEREGSTCGRRYGLWDVKDSRI